MYYLKISQCHSKTKWAIPEKNPNTSTGAGVEDMEFPGVLKKEHVEIPLKANWKHIRGNTFTETRSETHSQKHS